MPTTILDGETYEQARHRRFTEEAKVIEKMQQDEIIRMARELATRHGTRMCDENGETHGEELYCVGVDDIAEIIKQVAAKEREACLACYSPDDTATDWADKIRGRNEK